MNQPMPVPQMPLPPTPPSPSLDPSIAPQPAVVPPPRRFGKSAILMIVGGIVALLIAATGFAAWKGWLTLPGSPPTLEEITQASENITSASVTTTMSLKIEPRDPDTQSVKLFPTKEPDPSSQDDSPLQPSLGQVDAQNFFLSMIPADLNLSASISSVGQISSEQAGDGETAVQGAWKSGGLTAEFDLAFKRVDETLYAQINLLPILFIDVSPLAGTWVKLPQDIQTAGEVVGYQDSNKRVFGATQKEEQTPDTSFMEDVRSLRSEMLEDGALTVSNIDANARVNDRSAWQMTLAVDPEKLLEAFVVRCEAAENENKTHALFTESTCKPRSVEQTEYLEALLEHLTFDVWIDKKERMPVRVVVDLTVAPDTDLEKLKEKQIHLSMDIALSDINQPVAVEVPDSSISLDQANRLISNQSEEDTTRETQANIIRDLRTALCNFQKVNGSFPASLDSLMGTEQSLDGISGTVVVNIPLDQYTGQAFAYSSTGSDYALTYNYHLPDSGDGGLFSGFLPSRYVDGMNTATSYSASKEALSAKDTDNDGLDDYEEAAHGTNPNLKDTDGDGFGDKQEVDLGYDPLRNAKTGKTTEPLTSFDSRF